MPLVRLLLNILWIITGGLWMAGLWLLAAIIMVITIIGVPWARAAFNIALYALLPLIRNTYAGIRSVDPTVVDAGRAMGLTDRQLLFQVELPLASGVIVAGLRIATVVSIGLATIAAAIGAGGLGEFIFRGLAMVNNQVILAGAVPAALLALFADFVLGRLEHRLGSLRSK